MPHDDRLIVCEVPEFRLGLDSETQAHHAMIDLQYDLATEWIYTPEERERYESQMDAMVAKRREFLTLEGL
jgi:hypothetical protein